MGRIGSYHQRGIALAVGGKICLCVEQQTGTGQVIVAGYQGQMGDLRIIAGDNLMGILCILYCAVRLVLNDDPICCDALLYQPLGHSIGFRGSLIIFGSAAAGAENIGLGILLCRSQCCFQPAQQLLFHGAVIVQLVAQHHDTQRIVLGQTIRQNIGIDRHFFIDIGPVFHDGCPCLCLFVVNFRQSINQAFHLCCGIIAVVNIVVD